MGVFLPTGTPNNAGITATPSVLYTDESGDAADFTVVLDTAPSADVVVDILVSLAADEVTVSPAQVTFNATNWNVPVTITVTGVDDALEDGVQQYIIDAAAVAPFNDADYTGLGASLSGFNADDDGGFNGPPLVGEYRLFNVGTELTMTSDGAGLIRETNILEEAYTAADNQHVELVLIENGQYKLQLVHATNMFIDIALSSTVPGTNVWQWTGNSSRAQLWELQDAGDNTFHIVSVLRDNLGNGGHFLTVEPSGNISVNVDDGSDLFRWQFLRTGFAPVAVATADEIAGNVPLEVQFTGSASTDDKNDIVSYLWDFGDGTTSTEVNPIYTYTTPGTYNASLTITDGDDYEDVSDVITIVVNAPPVAVASSNVTEGDTTLTVDFTGDQSTDDVGIVSYEWVFEPGEVSSDANPTHSFDTAGVFNVELTVTDDGGLVDTETIVITVTIPNGEPTAVLSANVTSGDAPLEVTFSGEGSLDDIGVVSYAWDFGEDTVSTEMNPTFTYTTPGVYTVTLTVTDADGLFDSNTLTITVNSPNQAPVAVATADVLSGQSPLEVSFVGDQSTDDIGVTAYSWDFGDGTTDETANPTHTFNTVGTFNVVLTVTDASGLQSTDTLEITTTEIPNMAPMANASADITTGEAPLTVNFIGDTSTDDVAVVSYNWDFGDGATSTMANPSHTYTSVGVFTAELTVADGGGLESTVAIQVTVTDTPIVVPPNVAPTSVSSADVLTGDTPLLVNFTGDQSTDDVSVVSYAWDFGDGTTSTDANPTHTYTTSGVFTVTLTVVDSAGLESSSSLEVTSVTTTSTEEPSFEFILAPNPSTDQVQVVMDDNFDTNDIIGVMIHDSAGRLVRQFTREEFVSSNMTISTAIYRTEVYVITVMFNNNEPVAKRLIINN